MNNGWSGALSQRCHTRHGQLLAFWRVLRSPSSGAVAAAAHRRPPERQPRPARRTGHAMGVRKSRARPAAFAVGTAPVSPVPAQSAWPAGRPSPGTEKPPETGRPQTESWPAQAEEAEWWPPGAEVWPSEAEELARGRSAPAERVPGERVRGERAPGNGYQGNGHPGNGHQGNGHPDNGYAGNGHPGTGYPGDGQQPGAGYPPGHGRWPGNDGWRPRPESADPGPAPARPEDEAPRSARRPGPESVRSRSTDYPAGSQIAGAPGARTYRVCQLF